MLFFFEGPKLYHRATPQWETKILQITKVQLFPLQTSKLNFIFPPTRGKLDPFKISVIRTKFQHWIMYYNGPEAQTKISKFRSP